MILADITGILMPLSYAFQIIGATFLLIGSKNNYKKLKEKQKSEPEDKSLLNFPIQCAGVMVGTDYTMSAQSEFAKMLSFCDIALGYVFAVLSTSCPLSRGCQLTIVLVASFALFLINQLLLYVVKLNFKKLFQKKPKSADT